MRLELDRPLDMHIHLRQGAMLEAVAPLSARSFAGGVVMPNLVPPVDGLERLLGYRRDIESAIAGETFDPRAVQQANQEGLDLIVSVVGRRDEGTCTSFPLCLE